MQVIINAWSTVADSNSVSATSSVQSSTPSAGLQKFMAINMSFSLDNSILVVGWDFADGFKMVGVRIEVLWAGGRVIKIYVLKLRAHTSQRFLVCIVVRLINS